MMFAAYRRLKVREVPRRKELRVPDPEQDPDQNDGRQDRNVPPVPRQQFDQTRRERRSGGRDRNLNRTHDLTSTSPAGRGCRPLSVGRPVLPALRKAWSPTTAAGST